MFRVRWSSLHSVAPFFLACLFLALVLLTGGGSRSDVQSLIVLRPMAVIFGGCALFFVRPGQFSGLKWLFVMLLALAALMAVQLIPIPQAIWEAIPGRAKFGEIGDALGLGPIARPISLSPARTWNSFVSLVVPMAALLLFAALHREARFALLPWCMGLIFLSGLLGLVQLIGSPDGPLYLYQITNRGSAVGFFANRNHQAMLLACLFPMLAVFASMPGKKAEIYRFRFWLCACGAIFLIPLLLVTGSRSGIVLGLLGTVFAWLLYDGRAVAASGMRMPRRRTVMLSVAGLLLITFVASMAVMSRTNAVERLAEGDVSSDLRFKLFGPLVQIARDYFPLGAGFGTFENVYRVSEPDELLQTTYINHAHNDLLELMIESGLPGFVLLCVFLFWWGRRVLVVWSRDAAGGLGARFGRLGSVITLLLLLGSLLDYPLRVPFVAAVFVLGCVWLATGAANIGKKSQMANGAAT